MCGAAGRGSSVLRRKYATVVYGGAGQLGRAVVSALNANKEETISVDLEQNPEAKHNLVLSLNASTKENVSKVMAMLEKMDKLDAVLCVAGGFSMAPLKSAEIFDDVDKMHHANVRSAVAASHVAAHTLKEGGLLVLSGAFAALVKPTPAMLGYGISKVATHHLVLSLADTSAEGSPLPKGSTVVGVLPTTLDTETNRRDMPNGNFNNWTDPSFVAGKMADWVKGVNRPKTGSLISFHTTNKVTTLHYNSVTSTQIWITRR